MTAAHPLVTVITPVLNRASTISSCLASVAAQSYPVIEHIIVDGGSRDGTLDLVRSFQSRGRLRWISEPDDGMYDAINKGLDMADGEIVAYLNSDDFYLPWTVDVAVRELDRGADLIYGDLGVVKMRSETHSEFYVQFYRPFDLKHYVYSGSIGQPTVFWRRSLIGRIGRFDSSYRLIGDCEYWVRAAVSGAKLSHVHEVLAIQIDHGATLREIHPDRLEDEFRRLRAAYARIAGRSTWLRWRALWKALRWRWYQLLFLAANRRERPNRWPRFIAFLRRHDLKLNRLDEVLVFMLPGRFRPSWASWVDTRMFEAKLREEIGADGGSQL